MGLPGPRGALGVGGFETVQSSGPAYFLVGVVFSRPPDKGDRGLGPRDRLCRVSTPGG